MPQKVRIVRPMKISEVTPEWIRLRLRTKGMRIGDLAETIPLERTKVSKSLTGKRNFLGWELARIVEVLGEAEHYALPDPEIRELLEDYLALSESDRLRARALMRALLSAEALEENPPAPDETRG